jgi:hypothetical protein
MVYPRDVPTRGRETIDGRIAQRESTTLTS